MQKNPLHLVYSCIDNVPLIQISSILSVNFTSPVAQIQVKTPEAQNTEYQHTENQNTKNQNTEGPKHRMTKTPKIYIHKNVFIHVHCAIASQITNAKSWISSPNRVQIQPLSSRPRITECTGRVMNGDQDIDKILFVWHSQQGLLSAHCSRQPLIAPLITCS